MYLQKPWKILMWLINSVSKKDFKALHFDQDNEEKGSSRAKTDSTCCVSGRAHPTPLSEFNTTFMQTLIRNERKS